MNADWKGTGKPLAYGAAAAVNSIIGELAVRCRKGEEVAPRVMIGCYGYAGTSVDWAAPDFRPEQDGLISIKTLAECDKQVLDEENEVFIPWVVYDKAHGGTPMQMALNQVRGIAEAFAQSNPNSFPPIIINITDGAPTDMDETDLPNVAQSLTSLTTADGNALLWNLHISPTSEAPQMLPNSEAGLPDNYSKCLFQASSVLPEFMANLGRTKHGLKIGEDARCFAYNADAVTMTKLLVLASSAPNEDREQ